MALVSKLIMMALLAPGIMMADICASSETCTYSIGTGLDTSTGPPMEDSSATRNLTFPFAGPEMLNAAAVPEPASGILLGTVAAIGFYFLGKRGKARGLTTVREETSPRVGRSRG